MEVEVEGGTQTLGAPLNCSLFTIRDSALLIGARVVVDEHLVQQLRRVLGPAHRHAAHSRVRVQRVVVAAWSCLVAEEVDAVGAREAVLLEESHAVPLVPAVRVHVQRDLAACTCSSNVEHQCLTKVHVMWSSTECVYTCAYNDLVDS